ncbi:sigma-70 family RNA polymerase sigma factor [Brevibacterium sp. FAM 25378]|uniref:sigma-70 family RNA polymerase sigma factor n=1 Tax=unclassified Brevibacterium TaxID=2614124 RepID=UPI00109313D2|nr:sigma-70 family RNA polymerase sigma factor [Brevibacterium sp. S22]TGD32077.1 sigma-70 family RNA polymerase sigma factor [Brevibacterium sp. S22]
MDSDHADELALRFDAERPRLTALAIRLLGDQHAAEDAVQEAWLRLSRQDARSIDSLPAWLTTVVSRICLDQLRARRPEVLSEERPDSSAAHSDDSPSEAAVLAESLSEALVVVLETLSPLERLAFVLHDLFDVPFVTIAEILSISHAGARQHASRARRRIRGQSQGRRSTDYHLVAAFLEASRGGDFAELISLLAPDAVLEVDAAARALGAEDLRTGQLIADTFSGRARGAALTTVDGRAAAVWMHRGRARMLFTFGIRGGRITRIDMTADPDTLSEYTRSRSTAQ